MHACCNYALHAVFARGFKNPCCCPLQIPDVQIDSAEKSATDSELVLQLEHFIAEWSQVLAGVMQRESEKQPNGKGPLAEIEFWRERNAVLSALYEQINLPHVKKMVQVVEIGSDDRNLMAGFKSQVGMGI